MDIIISLLRTLVSDVRDKHIETVVLYPAAAPALRKAGLHKAL
jgi:hypothetical protein